MEWIKDWFDQFGYIVLFLSLVLELIALPIPGELLMSYSGILISEGQLDWVTSIVMAGAGSSVGMTIAYAIGRKLGVPFFEKFGHRIHMGPDRLEKVGRWFQRYGNKMIIFGYFIPGVRHFTGYFAGISGISYRGFAIYAYLGAFVWTSTFISLGKLLGPKWELYQSFIKKYLMIGAVIAIVLLAVYFLVRTRKEQIYQFATTTLSGSVRLFHSFGRVKFLVTGVAALFLAFFGLMIGLVQDYLANEFAQFDQVGTVIIHAMFPPAWSQTMHNIGILATWRVLIPIVFLTLIWIWFKGRNRLLESGFLLIVWICGEVVEEGLRRMFHRLGPAGTPTSNLPFTFPSEQSLMILAVMGFSAYLIIRHTASNWLRTMAPLAVLIVVLMVGLSRVYAGVQYPSDVAAGFVFGGVWISLNIIVMELFRLLRKDPVDITRERP